MYEYKLIQHIRVDNSGRMTVISSTVEHLTNPVDVLSTTLGILDNWLETNNQFEKVERDHYIGVRRKAKPRKRYECVICPLKDSVTISLPIGWNQNSGFQDTLFPYLEKYVFENFNNNEELKNLLSDYLNTLI